MSGLDLAVVGLMFRALAVLALIAACHHATVHKPGDEWLQAVTFDGNRSLSSGATGTP